MRITVKYSAQLRQLTGLSREEIEMPAGCLLRELLLRLAGEREALRPFLLDAKGALRPSLLLCLGEEQVQPDCATPLKDGSELSLLSPISGG